MAQKLEWNELDDTAVNTARVLAADAVEKVGNGHPGTAISLAPAAYLLYQKVMRHDPTDPKWIGRDRFILSAGHSSLTQYVQLFLGGFGLELNDLQSLRTLHSRTPGHPEYGHTDGVEITTGPLGQGLASAVGFAYAQRFERGLFDPDAPQGKSPFDHFTYVIAGDGDMQEGVTSEASSLAGHQELGNLVVIYDANQISIEDDTDISFTEDVRARYESYGWQVIDVNWRTPDGYVEDVHALFDAISQAQTETSRPSLIILHTIIGWPSPNKQDTGSIHGSALGADELASLKQVLGFNSDKHFIIDDQVLAHTRQLRSRSAVERATWQTMFDEWAARSPERKALFDRMERGELPEGLESALPTFVAGTSVATRSASGKVLNAIAPHMPELWGGSADLAGSNNTTIDGAASFVPAHRSTSSWKGDPYGRVMHFGIREHAMAAIINGIQLHGKTRSYGGTFLQFADYMRPAVRLAALMNVPSIFVWTHDSIGLGEDGPTHQPIEHLAALRAIPNLTMVRPADANEVSVAWHEILKRNGGPVGIALSRQNVPVFERSTGEGTKTLCASAQGVRKGAYVLIDTPTDALDVIIIATGSEVQLALSARETLLAEGIGARVVSAPSLEWFAEQTDAYRESVLPSHVAARVSVEAGISLGWREIVGDNGRIVSIDEFGASADAHTLFTHFGITAEAVTAAARESLAAATQKRL